MIIDDSEADRYLSEVIVSTMDPTLNIIFAEDGFEALEVLKASGETPDLILLDINMPRISGFELLKKLRCNDELRSYRDLPVWVMTTSEADRDLERADEYGVAGYIRKTFQSSDVNMILHRILGEGSAGAG